ncbi:MAG TPA: cytochrome c-type biogenesis protein CcmH [Terracidiphilus sp.]|nr:cytochrome c-type biogenesis protein CcmH [Terracidiphilus sp.]
MRSLRFRSESGAPSLRGLLLKGGRGQSTSATFWLKSAQALLLAIAVCFSVGASNSSSRLESMDHKLMCTCGCAQVLGECDHAGCPSRGQEMAELSSAIATGATDDQILKSFAAKYGATVLAAPTTHGFDLVAWVAPIAVFAAALLGTILLVRQWSIGKLPGDPAPAGSGPGNPEIDALREKIRRETGSDPDGGFSPHD